MYTNLLITASLAATTSAAFCTKSYSGPFFTFFARPHGVAYERLDPALFPGQNPSPHLHIFDGANAVSANPSYQDLQDADCNTTPIKHDRSLYWRPALFMHNDTGFYRAPEYWTKFYYKFGDAGNVRANVTEFPENFAMITGNAMLRHDDQNTTKNAQLKWTCRTGSLYDGTGKTAWEGTGFGSGSNECTTVAASVTFPDCWNGKDIDPKNPMAHMAYLANGPYGKTGVDACPEGFRVARFPQIMIEYWYDTSSFIGTYSGDNGSFVLADGDPTGYSMHADFKNGWTKGSLANATKDGEYFDCGDNCNAGTDAGAECTYQQFFGAANVNLDQDADYKTCGNANATSAGGDASTTLAALPGCNAIQSGPADATAVATCSGSQPTATATSSSKSRRHERHARVHARSM